MKDAQSKHLFRFLSRKSIEHEGWCCMGDTFGERPTRPCNWSRSGRVSCKSSCHRVASLSTLRKARAFITRVSLEPRKCRLPEATCAGSGIVLCVCLCALIACYNCSCIVFSSSMIASTYLSSRILSIKMQKCIFQL